ncbi:zinc metalloprotease HtpX [Candidatus Roizmanbacteria bacterium]|nr:zinc metalloprotease HtpX [Candidatus Roizmanbacteria bacterium]
MTNTLKTFALLGILSVILITLGGFLGGRDGIYMAFFFSLLMNGGMYFFSDKLALSMSGAKPLSKNTHGDIYAMVEELSRKIKIPMPKLYITPQSQANAFATGRGPGHASVAVTQGILDTLSKEELRGVLAHELSHVKNRDILVATIAAVLASAISFLANMSLFGGYSRDNDNRGAGAFGLFLALLVPIAASLVQMAISRQREFGADETGARTIGTGAPLAKALVAIHDSARRKPMHANPAFSSLYIGDPLGGWGGKMLHLFSTHPPLQERVKKLERIK